MDIEPGTRIGADGDRHPAGTEPSDASKYNRRLVRVQGELEDGDVPVWHDEEEGWLLGAGGGGGASSYKDLTDVDLTGLVNGQVPTWDGAKWVPGDPGDPAGTAAYIGGLLNYKVDNLGPGDVGADPAGTAASLVGGLGPSDVGADPAGTAADLIANLDAADVGADPAGTAASAASAAVAEATAYTGAPIYTRDYATGVQPVSTLNSATGLLAASSDPNTTPELMQIRAKLADIVGQPGRKVRIAVIGDSLTRWHLWWQLERTLAHLHNRVDIPNAYPPDPAARPFHDEVMEEAAGGTGFAISPIGRTSPYNNPNWLNLNVDPRQGPGMGSVLLQPGALLADSLWCDGVDIYYLGSQAGGGTVTVTIDGVEAGTFDTSQPGYVWSSEQYDLGFHDIELTSTATAVLDYCYQHRGTVFDGVEVHPFGHGGWKQSDFLTNNRTISHLGTVGFDAVILALGTNDNNAYSTNLQAMITAVRTAAPNIAIILWIPPAQGTRSTWATQRDAVLEIAKTNKIAVVDSFAQFGWTAQGGPLISQDNTHLEPASSALVCEATVKLFTDRTTPLYPESRFVDPTNPLDLINPGIAFWAGDPSWTPPSDGDPVPTVRTIGRNVVSKGAWLRQDTALNRPTFDADGWDGKPALRFDGTQWLLTEKVNVVTGFTIVVAFQSDSLGQTRHALGHSTSSNRGVGHRNTGTWLAQSGTLLGGGTADTDPHLVVVHVPATGSGTITVDGVLVASGNVGTNNAIRFTVGAASPNVANWIGTVHFAGVYLGDVTTDPNWPRLQALLMPS